jgi:poly-gamma-glutamate synthesis protein (capsule biosynthesis protein)
VRKIRILTIMLIIIININVSFAAIQDFEYISSNSTTTNELDISFVGDVIIHMSQNIAAYNGKDYNFDYSFENVKEHFESKDLAIFNLETTLTSDLSRLSGYPLFVSPYTILDTLKDSGFDIALRANNHMLDGGKNGFINTGKFIDYYGFYSTGGEFEKEVKPLLIKKNGIKIGLANYTFGTNGILPSEGINVNYLGEEKMLQDIEYMKKNGVEFIIFLLHFGNEYETIPNLEQKSYVKFLSENGANLIVGSHPHVIQGYEKYGNTDVYYSLGNFVSNQYFDYTYVGAVLDLSLKRDSMGKIISSYRVIPSYVDRYDGEVLNHQIFLLDNDKYRSFSRIDNDDLQDIKSSIEFFDGILDRGINE